MGSVYPQIYEMGNICSVIAKEKKKAAPPHTLSELLSSLKFEDDLSSSNVQNEFSENIWLSRFADFLEKRSLDDELSALQFLVLTQPLHAQFNRKRTFGSSSSEKRTVFLSICDQFLSESSQTPIALDNSALFNDLQATSNSIRAGLKVSEESLDELLKARTDTLVWEEGLEPMYMKFVQQTNISQVACLLSLL